MAKSQKIRGATLAERLKAARVLAGLTQAEAAVVAEIGQSYWSEVEAGKRDPSTATLARLAKGVGRHARELLPD
jgi:transcriptional regulator with XRE-family HTH domain